MLFDFGGTLDADGVAWKERFHGLYRDEGAALSADDFARVFYDADDPLVGGLGRSADLAETVKQLTENIEAGLAARPPGRDPARGARVAARFLDETAATVARNREVLEALRARYRLGIVSNFYGNLEAVCQGLGLADLFEVMVDSEQVGASKPDPAIFHAALTPMAAAPEQAVMIGDSLHRDREGARRCGLDFIWIAADETRAAAGETGQQTVSSLGGLKALLL